MIRLQIKNKNRATKLTLSILLFITFIFFDLIYKEFCTVYFGYYGYITQPTISTTIISYLILTVLLLFFFLYPTTEFMLFINSLVIALFALPALVFFKNHPYFPVEILMYNLIFVFLMILIAPFKIRIPKVKSEINDNLLLLLIILLMLPFFIKFGLNFYTKSLFLYDPSLRRAALSKLSSVEIYIFNWLQNILIPFFIVYMIYKRRYINAFILFAFLIYLYFILTQRKTFYGAMIVIFLSFVRDYRKAAILFILGILGFSVLAYFAYKQYDYLTFATLIRRIFMSPQLNNIYYFDFFRDNHMKLSYSILSGIYDYPYEVKPPYLIGATYYNQPLMSANNGFISQGYMDFGVAGVILYTLFVVMLFIFFNSLDIHPVFLGIFVILLFTIINVFITTTMLTHGGWLLIILSFLFAYRKPNHTIKLE